MHYDGQIWSQALWEIRQGYVALGKTTAAWDTTLINSQFGYAPGTSFSAAAKVTYDEAARAATVRRPAPSSRTRSPRRGITF